MSLTINSNLMALNSARHLNDSYKSLSTSVRRLSSGLRVNSSADDAAGLAIRELMRADIVSHRQGLRNANDAISMSQTADGALGVIDEKLVRMKELAEQAATGTYNSDQRLLIDNEFQAMAAEIDRIANSTDFNGIHLLNGNLQGSHDGSGLNSSGAAKIHFGSGNDSAEDYYYIDIPSCSTVSLLFSDIHGQWPGARVDGTNIVYNVYNRLAGDNAMSVAGLEGIDYYTLPSGLENIVIRSRDASGSYAHKPHVNLFSAQGEQLTGVDPEGTFGGQPGVSWWNYKTRQQVITAGIGAGYFTANAAYANKIINSAGQSATLGEAEIVIITPQTESSNAWEEIRISKITDDLVFMIGGHHNGFCNDYDLEIAAEVNISIKTQDSAQKMLERIDMGIANKDKIRAHLGAIQNRLENTISNLMIQTENLQAAESRISDVDVAPEMTELVLNQVRTQSATAMLAQANSLPQMALQIIQG